MTINECEIEQLEAAMARDMKELWNDPNNIDLDRNIVETMAKILALDPYRYEKDGNGCQD